MELNKFNKYIKSFESNLFSADLTDEEYQEILKLILDKFLLLSKKEQLIFLLTKIPSSLEDIEAKNEQNVLNIELENKSEMIKIRSLAIRVFLICFYYLYSYSRNGYISTIIYAYVRYKWFLWKYI